VLPPGRGSPSLQPTVSGAHGVVVIMQWLAMCNRGLVLKTPSALGPALPLSSATPTAFS